MTDLAMVDLDDEGNSATWGDHVTAEEYNAAPRNTERLGKAGARAEDRQEGGRRDRVGIAVKG